MDFTALNPSSAADYLGIRGKLLSATRAAFLPVPLCHSAASIHQFRVLLVDIQCAHAQWCPTLGDSTDCSPPGSSAWDSPGKKTGVGCHFLFQGLFPIQRSNLRVLQLLHCQEGSSAWTLAPCQCSRSASHIVVLTFIQLVHFQKQTSFHVQSFQC